MRTWIVALIAAAGAVVSAGVFTVWTGGLLDFRGLDDRGNLGSEFWERLTYFGALALIVERATEVYLKVAGLDGVAAQDDRTVEVTRNALITALVIGFFMALVGIRILDTLVVPAETASSIAVVFFSGVDVLLSAALLAGGAKVYHPLIKGLTEVLEGFRQRARPMTSGGGVVVAGSQEHVPSGSNKNQTA